MIIAVNKQNNEMLESDELTREDESLIRKELKRAGFSDEDIKKIISAMSKVLSESMQMNESDQMNAIQLICKDLGII